MITTVMFDMGGTLENILVDEESKNASAQRVVEILGAHGYPVADSIPEVRRKLDAGWDRYDVVRRATDRELKPEEIWGNYILTDFGLGFEEAQPFSEELAYMWEVTYYKRSLRPRVKEMLEGLKGLGLKLGVISNTASLFEVFRILEDYGIRDYFSDVTLSSVTGYRKPHPYIFQVSFNQLKVEPSECVYAGDTYSRDVIGSMKAGFAGCFHIKSFLTKFKDTEVPKDLRARWSIEDIYDIYPILKEELEKEKVAVKTA